MTFRRPSSPWLRPWALILIVLMLVGAACGGDDDSDSVATKDKATTTTEPEATTTTAAGEPTTTTAAPATTTTVTTKPKSGTTPTTAPVTTTTAQKLSGEIVVLAAASLTEAFSEVGNAFRAANPETKVTFSFASSSALAVQANEGAPADLFASADDANMKKVTDAGNASGPKTFVQNRLAIIVQPGNPKSVAGLADFNNIDYVMCKDGVPCGTYAKEALDKVVPKITRPPLSYEQDVKAVVNRVTAKQVDAGIVYITDAKAAASRSDTVDIPDDLNVRAAYPIARLKQSSRPDVADAFISFVLSPAGQDTMVKYGFLRAS